MQCISSCTPTRAGHYLSICWQATGKYAAQALSSASRGIKFPEITAAPQECKASESIPHERGACPELEAAVQRALTAKCSLGGPLCDGMALGCGLANRMRDVQAQSMDGAIRAH
mmetsp:Transcript_40909/g.104016  ORF Transcript_40909/g.104016 Transcript_40909/m.104016 type:complete len:114 (+) Transcript_40909:240-581(+)